MLLTGCIAAFACPQTGHSFTLAAVESIDLGGNNIQTDGFDSADASFSNAGYYPYGQVWKTKASGDVYAGTGLTSAVGTLNYNIKGRIRTGPGVNVISIGPNSSIGDRAWVESGFKGIQPGHWVTNFSVIFPDVILPDKPWLPVTKNTTTVDGVSYDYVFTQGGMNYYRIDSPITGNVLINAPASAIVNLLVTTNVKLTDEVIRIANTGAKLRLYMAGSQFSLSGNGWIDNQSGMAERFYFFGLPACKSVTLGGNSQFYGVVYAPNADYTLGGGGNDTWDFVGASVTRTIKMNGHFNFHFDESVSLLPTLMGHPRSRTVLAGDQSTLGSLPIGSPPLTFYWLKNGVPMEGCTNSALTIKHSQIEDSGLYRVVATNLYGAVTSAPALLQVVTNTFEMGMVAHYPLNGDAADATGNGHHGTVVGQDWTYSLDRFGEVGGLYLNLTSAPTFNLAGACVLAPRSAALDFNQDFTLSVWVNLKPGIPTNFPYFPQNLIGNGSDATNVNLRIISDYLDRNGDDVLECVWHTSPQQDDNTAANLHRIRGRWWQVTAVRSGSNVSLFRNGALLPLSSSVAMTNRVANSPTLWFGSYNGTAYPLIGGMDDIRLYNRALSADEVAALYAFEFPDADQDGLNDREELNVHHTDPRKADTDGDGLNDRVEAWELLTNPLAQDTDADGYNDYAEIRSGKNPNDAHDHPAATLSVFPAIELEFTTQTGRLYRIQSSCDLTNWTDFAEPIQGDGNVWTRTYSTRGSSSRYFRVELAP